MAKKFKNFISLIALPAFLLAFAFAGCGEYTPPADSGDDPSKPGQPTEPVNPDNPDKPTNPTDSKFTIQLILVDKNKKTSVFTSELCKDVVKMTAQWTDSETGEVYRSAFNEGGVAENDSLDGDYSVSILNIPTQYTYEANKYSVDNDFREVTVTLYELGTLGIRQQIGDQPFYRLDNTGVYRTELKNETDKVMFQFKPAGQGVYSLLTLVDVTANEINPIVDVYNGNSAWISSTVMETADGGGVENTYTKNVYWEYNITADEVGGVFYFELYSTCRNADAYPLTVDFMLQRDKDFQNRYPQSTPVEVTEDFTKTPAKPAGTFRYCATRGGVYRLLDQTKVRLNPEDGYYYYYDAVTGEYGERLYAKISQRTEVADEPFTGTNMSRMLNYVVGYDSSDPKYYTDFINTYAQNCNSDGCYPVNEELKTFLQMFAVSQRYFNDGNGTAEIFANYNSDEESQWLYACGFYSTGA